jgi:hypothetical protein
MPGTGGTFGYLPTEHEVGEGEQRDGALLEFAGAAAGQRGIP